VFASGVYSPSFALGHDTLQVAFARRAEQPGICLACVGLWAQAKDPVIGAWTLNRAKSILSAPAGVSATREYQLQRDGTVQITESRTDSSGAGIRVRYAVRYCGLEYNVLAQDPGTGRFQPTGETISIIALHGSKVEGTFRRNGRVTSRFTRTVSGDSRTLTVRTTSVDELGHQTHSTLVYDRVET
jgi:hypothetical protein